MPTRLVLIGGLFTLVFFDVPVAKAQQASSRVLGHGEVYLSPGEQFSFAPQFEMPSLAGGMVESGVDGEGKFVIRWSGETAEWESSSASITSGDDSGEWLFLSPDSDEIHWNWRERLESPIFTGPLTESLLRPGVRVMMTPFALVDELAGSPMDDPSVFAGSDPFNADQFDFGGFTFWANEAGGEPRWEWIDAPGEDAGTVAVSVIREPFHYVRHQAAAGARRIRYQGLVRDQPLKFRIAPGSGNQPVFRIDGKNPAINTSLANGGFWTNNNPVTGLAGGATPERADQIVRWNQGLKAWEHIYYHTAAPAGWRSVERGAINPSTINLGRLTPFFWNRPDGEGFPPLEWEVKPVPNSVPLGTSRIAQIIDHDGDRIADGWEVFFGGDMNPREDPDLDGFTNFEEYLLGGDPTRFDHPAVPRVEIRERAIGAPEAWIKFRTGLGCRYHVQRWRSDLTPPQWGTIHATAIPGNGNEVEVLDPDYLVSNATTSASRERLRFYRVRAISPMDSDKDLVSDWEEVEIYQTNPDSPDTDLDGKKDGFELRTEGYDPLDYYNGRPVAFSIDPTTNRQIGPPNEWLRQAITATVKRNGLPLRNAPVTFVVTNGQASFSSVAGGKSESPHGEGAVTVRTGVDGVARAFLWMGETADGGVGLVQGRVSTLVADELITGLAQIYSAPFAAYISPHLALPVEGLVAHFRPDTGTEIPAGGSRLDRWNSVFERVEGDPSSIVSAAKNGKGPGSVTSRGRPWLSFDGSQMLDLGPGVLPNDTFSAFFVAAPSAARTSRSPGIAAGLLSSGSSGQRYLLAADIVAGASITVYDPPQKPANRYFSIWEQTFFNNDPFRSYHFSELPSGLKSSLPPEKRPEIRYDNTDGHRLTPAPAGRHPRLPISDFGKLFTNRAISQSPAWNHWQTSYTKFDDFDITHLGGVVAHEDYYQLAATNWKGHSGSAGFGGQLRLDYSRIDAVGFGLSVGLADMQPFHLRAGYFPAVANSAPVDFPSFSSGSGFLGSVIVSQRVPRLYTNTGLRSTGAVYQGNTLRPPRYIGGWQNGGNRFVGRLGDLVLYDRALTTGERQQVEDYLAAAYHNTSAGASPNDRDQDKLPDWWERAFVGDYHYGAGADPDNDGSTMLQEFRRGTHPLLSDTDGDGWNDELEVVVKKSNPTAWDSDGDFFADSDDLSWLNDAMGRLDADENGIADGIDRLIANGDLTDSDGDGISDILEALWINRRVP